ncbi:S-adenosylmethionine decarboxylase [Candidatus Falkowbacteria bacterium CG10_big_fil_rev_8_21_14_0_10_39_11]|uniref:S-adenosylmethionine decarboxylase n=1 Tax=Candidatus Falkowbacteria bacterium CG10_big_fil_rev_8_21_14_0_10_39_11 TaxID=1974565 RepID=A0A2H0V501_9BACT|nr:MAG: S-adenosylmethionine decarboxylase [Candidatus Falkowbacteria bacterium CG10_big_fil_rev_8_21_14_0_10_39_11]
MTNEEVRKAKKAWGLIAVVNLYDCNHEMIQSPAKIRQYVKELCQKIKMIPYGPTMVKKFGSGCLEGYSALQFIETSSITLHFDDKNGDRAFIDIFSCKYFETKDALAFSQEFFQAKKAKIKVIVRD